MRHGYPGPYVGDRTKDDLRALAQDGIDAVTAMATWMADTKRNYIPTSIACSPIKRCVMTAQIMSDTFGIKFTIDPNLSIGKPLEMVLKAYADDKSISRPLLIAHSDNLRPGLARLNYVPKEEVDPHAMGELRIIKLDRTKYTWKEKLRQLPGDLGCVDYF